MASQVKFYDKKADEIHAGIMTDDGDIICGCCGGTIPANEVGVGEQIYVLKVYKDWVMDEDDLLGGDPVESLDELEKAVLDKVKGDYDNRELQAKAILDKEEKTLTFYYDKFEHLNGDRNIVYEIGNDDEHPWTNSNKSDENRRLIETVRFDKSFKNYDIKNMTGMFENCTKLEKIEGLENIDTSNVKSISWMFDGCENLKELDLSDLDTSNVTTMIGTFLNCFCLSDIKGIDRLDTSNVLNMAGMFYHCEFLTELDLSNWNTHNVVNMQEMFSLCIGLKKLNLSNFDTSNVYDIRSMFANCRNLETVKGLENFNLENVGVINISDGKYYIDGAEGMFATCRKLEIPLDLRNELEERDNDVKSFLEQSVESADRGSEKSVPTKQQER